METLRHAYNFWDDLMNNKSDPRTRDWPLMSSPLPTIAICLSYAYFVKILGPRLMENRKPFELRKVLIVYNAIQVIFSTWLFYEACLAGWLTGYSWRCQQVDYSYSETALRTAAGCWWYYFSKFTEFFDTFFFVMRKRYDQVSTLHVIHHGIMPFSVWWGVKFAPGGHSSFFGFLNTFVHIVMYTYYMLAAMGPKVQKYLWWKKYLTIFQMIQFIAVMIHTFQLCFWNDCNYPMAFVYFIGGHALLFLFLFANFYQKAYTKKPKKDKDGQTVQNGKQTSNGHITQNGNGHITNGYTNGKISTGKSPFYESMYPLETSYSTTRQRVFVERNN
uniref:Elongation of very long chain fatty acids protein n=1 Tax=Culicoides sonorensis TaxID=179676 RepID=A0A336MNH3_CULSO